MSKAKYETSRKPNASTPHAGSNTVGSGDDFSEKAATYEKACNQRDAKHEKAFEETLAKLDKQEGPTKGGC